MQRLGPFHTLAAGAILVAGLGVLSATSGPATVQVAAAAGPAAEEPAADPTPSASAAPTTGPTTNATANPTAQPSAQPSARPSAQPSARPTAQADPTPKKADFAGVVQGNGGLIALSIRDGKAIAYFCDGRIEAWLKGIAKNDTLTLEGKNSVITAALQNGKAQGRVQVGDDRWRFVAPVVKKPSGLYRASAIVRGARVSGTWIRLSDGRQVGQVLVGGNAEAAPVLGPDGEVTVYGTRLVTKNVDSWFDDQAAS
ncbi:PT domain-containing protein [Thermopolyspora sp. NPDC052614]|uniref:PT domain-containing protein n=1 Tax=Thermopolyspora sp. NPDC052614 TaxID=3155682 RepID=UPI003439DE2D